jgi:hypothetical protein
VGRCGKSQKSSIREQNNLFRAHLGGVIVLLWESDFLALFPLSLTRGRSFTQIKQILMLLCPDPLDKLANKCWELNSLQKSYLGSFAVGRYSIEMTTHFSLSCFVPPS